MAKPWYGNADWDFADPQALETFFKRLGRTRHFFFNGNAKATLLFGSGDPAKKEIAYQILLCLEDKLPPGDGAAGQYHERLASF
jgi:hypothetical protein